MRSFNKIILIVFMILISSLNSGKAGSFFSRGDNTSAKAKTKTTQSSWFSGYFSWLPFSTIRTWLYAPPSLQSSPIADLAKSEAPKEGFNFEDYALKADDYAKRQEKEAAELGQEKTVENSPCVSRRLEFEGASEGKDIFPDNVLTFQKSRGATDSENKENSPHVKGVPLTDISNRTSNNFSPVKGVTYAQPASGKTTAHSPPAKSMPLTDISNTDKYTSPTKLLSKCGAFPMPAPGETPTTPQSTPYTTPQSTPKKRTSHRIRSSGSSDSEWSL